MAQASTGCGLSGKPPVCSVFAGILDGDHPSTLGVVPRWCPEVVTPFSGVHLIQAVDLTHGLLICRHDRHNRYQILNAGIMTELVISDDSVKEYLLPHTSILPRYQRPLDIDGRCPPSRSMANRVARK